MRFYVAVLVAGCTRAVSPSPPIVVRMGLPSDPPLPTTMNLLDGGCAEDGPPAPALREPIVAFALKHLMIDLSYKNRPIETPIEPKCEGHASGVYTRIDVVPRQRVSTLNVSHNEVDDHGHCTWGGTSRYCIRVISGAIVITPMYSFIGSATLARPPG